MAFVCTIDSDESPPHIIQRGQAHLLKHLIGYEDDENLYYSIFVFFEPQIGGKTELIFCVEVTDLSDQVVDTFWSGTRTNRLIKAEDRKKILGLLLRSISALLDIVQPSSVFICTIDQNPPEKAMQNFIS